MIQIKKLIALGAVALLGMVACVKPAQAQTYNFDAFGTDNGGLGQYHVVLQQNSPTQFVLISVHANGGANTPTSNVDHITLAFWTGAINVGSDTVLATSGGSGGTDVGGSNWGPGAVGADANTWSYNTLGSGPILLANGSNTFTTSGGASNVINLAAPAGTIHFVAQDGHQYEFTLTVVPEGSAVAMFLPGLLPVGLFLRKRFAKSAK